MKKRSLAAVMAVAISFSGIFIAGCGKDVPVVYEDNSVTDETENTEDIADVTYDEDVTYDDTVTDDVDYGASLDQFGFFPDAAYVIELSWDRSDGEEHLEDISYVEEEQHLNEDVVYAGDDLVYGRTTIRNGEEDEQKTIMFIGIYSLDHDMRFFIEPNGPENTIDLNSITVSVTAQNGSEEVSLGKDFNDVGARGETGIWYAGIFSIKDGKLGTYEW